MIDRRVFLKSSGLALFGTAIAPGVFVRMAEAGTTRGKKVLVAVFQRGAVDGLNMIVPYGEQAYYAARRSIAIVQPGKNNGAIDLDGFFGAHPALEALMPFYKDRSAAFIHAAGNPISTRSHFDAQDFMESGTPGVKSTRDGFLSRAMAQQKAASPLRAVALSTAMPRIMAGSGGALAMSDISRFGVQGSESKSFEEMYAGSVTDAVRGTAKDSFQASAILAKAAPSKLEPQNGARYPRGPLGSSLKQIAQLIRSDVGLEVAFTDVSGWDTHAAQGGSEGQLANNLRNFAEAIAAFAKDLGSRMSDVVLVTMSEFGRTVRENGNRGTDHGHATVMLALGGGVRGGKVLGKWPGLAAGQLFENRDLAVTTDFRDVFAELLTKQMGVASLQKVFPGHDSSPKKWLDVVQS